MGGIYGVNREAGDWPQKMDWLLKHYLLFNLKKLFYTEPDLKNWDEFNIFTQTAAKHCIETIRLPPT